MHKIFVTALTLLLCSGTFAYAQENAPTQQTTESALDKEADNLNIVPYEERLKLKRNNTKIIDMTLKNSTKGEISDIIKNANQAEKRAARKEGRSADTVNVNPSDKKAVRKFLQKDLFVEPYHRLD